MAEAALEADLSHLLSTYGLVTAERLLEKYNIHLSRPQLLEALKNHHSIYYKLLRMPVKNVLNGIVLQQAYDYLVFAQKLFIDLLLSGEGAKEGELNTGSTRALLEDKRIELVKWADAFYQQRFEHDTLIGESQIYLIDYTKSFLELVNAGVKRIKSTLLNFSPADLQKATNEALLHTDLSSMDLNHSFVQAFSETLGSSMNQEQKALVSEAFKDLISWFNVSESNLSTYFYRAQDMARQLDAFRKQFYAIIIQTKELMVSLPEYKHNAEQESINIESLYFDPTIGTESGA